MKLIGRHILSIMLAAMFLFYSAGVLNITAPDTKTEHVCFENKNCSCCMLNGKTCCCKSSIAASVGIVLPCSQPGFEGVNFHLDPLVFFSFEISGNVISYEDYISCYLIISNQSEPSLLFKPPCA